MNGKLLVVWLLAGASLARVGSAQSSLVEWREQVIAGVCTLRFAVPQGWQVRVGVPLPGAVDVRIKPPEGTHGEILVSGMVPKGAAKLGSAGEVKAAVRKMGEAMLDTSVEKKLTLEKLAGTDGAGYFYSLTDKRAQLPATDYRYMTQGVMAVGPLRLAATAFGDAADSPARAAAFELLRTAVCTPGTAPPPK